MVTMCMLEPSCGIDAFKWWWWWNQQEKSKLQSKICRKTWSYICAQNRCCSKRETDGKTHKAKPQTTRPHYLHCTWNNSFILSQNSAIPGTSFTITSSWLLWANTVTAKSAPALLPQSWPLSSSLHTICSLGNKEQTHPFKDWQPHKPQAFLCQS